MSPISLDLRERILTAHKEGETQQEIADRLFVSQPTVSRVLQRYQQSGNVIPDKPGGNRPLIAEEDHPLIIALVTEKPDISLADLSTSIAQTLNKPPVSKPVLCKLLKKLKLNRKKKSRQASEQDREDIKKKSGLSRCFSRRSGKSYDFSR